MSGSMCMGEWAEVAGEIVREDFKRSFSTPKSLMEDVEDESKEFMNEYEKALEILQALQSSMTQMIKKGDKKLMGDGTFTKAYNSAKKLEIQMNKTNSDAANFIENMKAFLKSNASASEE